MSLNLEELAAEIVSRARRRGADGVECLIGEGEEFSASVRMREVESLKNAGSRSAGLRVLVGKRAGSAYTSDLTAEGLDTMIGSALELAAITSDDPFAGLPEPEELGQLSGDLQLWSGDVGSTGTTRKIELSRAAEEAALSFDPRIQNSEGASCDSYQGRHVFANSLGFVGSYRTSTCSLSVVPIARQGETMERDYWYSLARGFGGLDDPAAVGRKAAIRALRRLGSRKVSTCKVPVIFDPQVARSLVQNIFEAVNGEAVYRKSSFLAGRLGERVGSEVLTVIDDSTLPGLFGTSPFDDEGVASRRTVVLEGGVLKSYLLNCYTARKLGLKTTGSATRGITGNSSVGHGNFYLQAGTHSPESIVKQVKNGYYVTELMGFGVNAVTGDYSRGASGIWIENGELAYPVSEVTVSGNLKQMLMDLEAVGGDLEFRGATASPTLLIREMTVSGH